jgi:hypothetical protein
MDRAADSFVIWIDAEALPASCEAGFAGRIEHVQTAARGTFQSAKELLDFLVTHRGAGARDAGAS